MHREQAVRLYDGVLPREHAGSAGSYGGNVLNFALFDTIFTLPQLISSGAFEISLNDVPVWSKLETGRIPAPQELFQIIDSHLQFSDKIEQNPDFVK